ncbi:hypothetical protein B0H11DRAFT_783712 [Mycena galericulata]|nr:hypothetical protein B0H11DRAFT_783712 [Mycena galericulata]
MELVASPPISSALRPSSFRILYPSDPYLRLLLPLLLPLIPSAFLLISSPPSPHPSAFSSPFISPYLPFVVHPPPPTATALVLLHYLVIGLLFILACSLLSLPRFALPRPNEPCFSSALPSISSSVMHSPLPRRDGGLSGSPSSPRLPRMIEFIADRAHRLRPILLPAPMGPDIHMIPLSPFPIFPPSPLTPECMSHAGKNTIGHSLTTIT